MLPDQEKVPGHGEDYVLQSNGDAGGEKTRERGGGAQLARKSDGNDDRNKRPDHTPTESKKWIAPAGVGNVAEGCSPPQLGDREHHAKNHAQPSQPHQQSLEPGLVLGFDGVAPVGDSVLVDIEKYGLAPQGQQ